MLHEYNITYPLIKIHMARTQVTNHVPQSRDHVVVRKEYEGEENSSKATKTDS